MSVFYRQTVGGKEEVFVLKKCFVDLGVRVPLEDKSDVEEVTTSDEEFLYFDPNSDTESYDSDRNGFHQLVQRFERISGKKVPKHCQGLVRTGIEEIDISQEDVGTDTNKHFVSAFDKIMAPKTSKRTPKKKKSATRSKSKKTNSSAEKLKESEMVSSGPKVLEPESNLIPERMEVEDEDEVIAEADQSLLSDDFFEKNMNYFMSQSMTATQTSALIQQSGRFSYIQNKRRTITPKTLDKEQQHIPKILLTPIVGLFSEENPWPLVLKTLQQSMFAFKMSSHAAKTIVHKMIAHYDWTANKIECLQQELPLYQFLHNNFLHEFMSKILHYDYSRTDIITIIGGSREESEAWLFISKLIQFLINQSILNKDFSLALSHLKLIIDVLFADFRQFLCESDNYYADIRGNNKPIICRLIWSNKSPDYVNSVYKQVIYYNVKVMKTRNTQILVETFRLFDLAAESLRIGSGNVRPLLAFSLDKPTPTIELYQQMIAEKVDTNENIHQILILSTLPWISLQFCGLFFTNFITSLKTKYLTKKYRHISLKLLIECITNASFAGCVEEPPAKGKKAKITLKDIEDAELFIRLLTSFINFYVQTTRITKFVEFGDPAELPETEQHLWPQVFETEFNRDISETDVVLLIEEMSVFRELPKILEPLKKAFGSICPKSIATLEFTLQLIFKQKKLRDLFER